MLAKVSNAVGHHKGLYVTVQIQGVMKLTSYLHKSQMSESAAIKNGRTLSKIMQKYT